MQNNESVVVLVLVETVVIVVVIDQELKKECHYGFCLHQLTKWFLCIHHFLCSVQPLSCQPLY